MRGVLERFWSNLKVPSGIGECWEWQTGKTSGGYGRFSIGTKKIVAHRFAYEQINGQIPEGLEIDHLCRNRACINPYHLEAVTPKVNVYRSTSLQAENAKKTHCIRGHALEGANLVPYHLERGKRECVICHNARNLASKWRRERQT